MTLKGKLMNNPNTPHTQSQQNRDPKQSDLDSDQNLNADDPMYENMEGAETGMNRSPRRTQTEHAAHNTEPETMAHEGSVSTRTPKRPAQGITSHSAEEESARQEKVVKDRPDAQAGLNHSK